MPNGDFRLGVDTDSAEHWQIYAVISLGAEQKKPPVAGGRPAVEF